MGLFFGAMIKQILAGKLTFVVILLAASFMATLYWFDEPKTALDIVAILNLATLLLVGSAISTVSKLRQSTRLDD